MEHLLTELQQTPLAFVVHVGDLGTPSLGSCTNEFWARRLAQFQASVHPFIYTPGDNEWTDCHEKEGAPGYEPLERLARLRTVFFPGDQSLGQRTLPLTRQSQTTDPVLAKYRENAQWTHGGITFMTVMLWGAITGWGARRRVTPNTPNATPPIWRGCARGSPGSHEPEPDPHDHAASQYLSRVPAISRPA